MSLLLECFRMILRHRFVNVANFLIENYMDKKLVLKQRSHVYKCLSNTINIDHLIYSSILFFGTSN